MSAPAMRLVAPVLAALALCAGAAGCTRWAEQTVARYEVGGPAKLRPAPEPGEYRVTWAATPDGPRRAVPSAMRVLPPDVPIGFAPGEAGGVVAIAGRERFPIDGLPPAARHLAWSTRVPKKDRRFPAMAGRALVGAARVATGVTLFAAVVALDAAIPDDDDGCRDGSGGPGHHDHDRGGSKRDSSGGAGRGYVPWAEPPKVSP